MQSYFADTSFWIALVDRRDSHHIHAVELSQQVSGCIVTTEAVVLETANSLACPGWRPKVIGLINHLKQRSDVSILPLTPELWKPLDPELFSLEIPAGFEPIEITDPAEVMPAEPVAARASPLPGTNGRMGVSRATGKMPVAHGGVSL